MPPLAVTIGSLRGPAAVDAAGEGARRRWPDQLLRPL